MGVQNVISECTGVTSVSAGVTIRFLKLLISTLVYLDLGKHAVVKRE